ncbi:gliding motility-associated C-terminal domain-containing protein [Parapedobacter sp. 2B3]
MLCTAGYVSAQTGQSVHIVQGSSVTLRADATHALSYLWFHDDEPINGFHDQRLVVSEAGTYTVMALGNECNSDLSDPVEVIVDPGGEPVVVDMQIHNAPDRHLAMINELISYQLLAINKGSHTATGVVVTAKLPANVRYETVVGAYVGQVTYNAATHELMWLPGDMAPGQSEPLTISVRASNEGMAMQLAIVTSTEPDSNPDDNEAAATVEVVALKIPNGFTPNGDGLNDLFEIRGLEFYPENRLLIFNRWGNEVYSVKTYKNDWDGADLNEGTYYYIFELRLHSGHWQTFKGFVTIVRNVNK